jgi:hypothetical protein
MAGIEAGAVAGKITGVFTVGALINAVMSLVFFAVFAGALIFLIKRMNWVSKALILKTTGAGGFLIKEDYIKRTKNTADNTYVYELIKEKAQIREISNNYVYPFKKNKGYVILVEGKDGYFTPLDISMDYVDDKGKVVPYLKPIDVDLRDWAYQKQTQKLEKYSVKTAWDKISPFATIAVVGIICVIMLHTTMKSMVGVMP